MNENEFILGKPYFMVSYFDENIKIPYIETYIYIGKNLLKTENEDIWYFKEPDSFLSEGYVLTEELYENCICLGMDTIELVLDFLALTERLNMISKR